ncbi:MAG TPA: murein biosynthesis integral membrane protein MurJ [Anaerolineae bacterium]|nr:murein biosynthesis integral membrane protein MurJ [Anaerolineae bacterium]
MSPSTPMRRIARAASLVMALFIVSRALGLVREMVIGARFGASADLDAYLAAFRLPDLIFTLVAGGALASAFIPTFSERLAHGDVDDAWTLASKVGNLLLLSLISWAVLAGLLAQPLVAHIIAPGFTPEQQALTVSLMRWMLLSTVIFGISGLIMGVLQSFHHFLLPALAPVLYNASITLAALALAPNLGVYALALGVVAGAALHIAIQIPGLAHFKARWHASLSLADAGVREVLRLMAPRVLGLAVVQINFIVNVFLASHLVEGSISALNYAWLIMLLPQGIFAQSIATAAFPTFSHQAALGQRRAMQHTLGGLFSLLIFLTLPSAVILILLRQPIVALLLQRGAFDARATAMTAYALGFFALGLVGHALVEVSARSFYALKDTKTPVIIGISAMALNVLLSLILIRPLAHGGLALANALATTLEMGVLLWMLRKRLRGLEERRVAASLGRAALAAGLMAGLVFGLMGMLPPLSLPWQAILYGSLAVAAYLLFSWLLQSPELVALPRLLRRG